MADVGIKGIGLDFIESTNEDNQTGISIKWRRNMGSQYYLIWACSRYIDARRNIDFTYTRHDGIIIDENYEIRGIATYFRGSYWTDREFDRRSSKMARGYFGSSQGRNIGFASPFYRFDVTGWFAPQIVNDGVVFNEDVERPDHILLEKRFVHYDSQAAVYDQTIFFRPVVSGTVETVNDRFGKVTTIVRDAIVGEVYLNKCV